MQFRFDLCCGWPAVGKSAFGEKCVGVGFVCESSRFFSFELVFYVVGVVRV